MALKNYSATVLTGGGSGALDSIDGTNLQDKDSCIVFDAATFYFYTLDDDSGAAESSPDVISPDANAGNKRWLLMASLGIGGVITLANTGLHLLDSDATHDLIIKPGSNLTADKTLTITTGDSDRTITLSGNPTLADWFDQAVKAASSPTFANATITTAITLANTGLHLLDSNASHDLIIKPGSDLTADRTLTLTTGNADRTVTLGGNLTVAGTTTISAFGATLTDDANAATALGTLGLTATAVEINSGVDGLTATASQLNSINKIWTYQNTAPSGWSIVASTSDALIACKGGANAYNTTGGQQIGTWTQPNHLHTTGSHALSVAELAPHAHTLAVYAWDGSQHTARGSSDSALQASQATSSTGSGTAHSHGNTGNGATAATYRPLANLGIVIEKT